MRYGAKLPDFGPLVFEVPPSEAAARAEEAGFDSVWVSDHIVMIEETRSKYPYSRDGTITWDAEAPRLDAIVAMAAAASTTDKVRVGVAILLAGLRNPLVLAKQIATLDALSGGRIVLGVGAGWLAEEFEALAVPFETRGQRLNEWIEIMRACWTGRPAAASYDHYELPAGVLSFPTPQGDIPILIGGMSKAALRRAGRLADGWLAFQNADSVDVGAIRKGIEAMRAEAAAAGRTAEEVIVRLTGALGDVSAALPHLEQAGVQEVIVEVDWASSDGPSRTLEAIRAT